MNLRKIVVSLAAVFLIIAMAGFQVTQSQASEASDETFTLRFGHVDSAESNIHKSLLMMSDAIKERTNGAVVIEVSPNSMLGGERDLFEGMQLGTVDMAASTTSPLTNFVPEFYVLDGPFLFKSDQHAFNAADGALGEAFNKLMLEQQNIRILGYSCIGFRELFCSKPVEKVEDLAGLKIRTMQTEMHMGVWSAWKAMPTPMPLVELYTALQQKTVDGGDAATEAIVDMKFYEPAPNITLLSYSYSLKAFMIAEPVWNKLPEEYHSIISEEATKAIAWQRAAAVKEREDDLVVLRNQGCNVIKPDIQPFIDAAAVVYEQFADRIRPDLLEMIRNTPE